MSSEHLESSSSDRKTNPDGKISADILQRLKPREHEVLVEWAKEPNAKRVAKRLGLSKGTVANYLTRICQHLGASSQAELMKLLLEHRPPNPPPEL